MDIFNLIAGSASIASLILAAYLWHKRKVSRVAEKGNVSILIERLNNISTSLRAAATTTQALIRRADDHQVPVPELQNIARAVRTDLYGALLQASATKTTLLDWRFGELLVSSKIEEIMEAHGEEQMAEPEDQPNPENEQDSPPAKDP